MIEIKSSKIELLFFDLLWNQKLRVLQAIKGWSQYEAAKNYCTTQKQVWSWNNGLITPQRKSRKAIAEAHGLEVSDIFPAEMLTSDEIGERVC